VANQAISTVLR